MLFMGGLVVAAHGWFVCVCLLWLQWLALHGESSKRLASPRNTKDRKRLQSTQSAQPWLVSFEAMPGPWCFLRAKHTNRWTPA